MQMAGFGDAIDLMAMFNSLTFNGQPVLPPKAAGN
jgi:hypothetical protein